MIHSAVLAWTLTLLFAATGGYCLLRCVHPGSGVPPADRLAAGADLLMSVGMLAMVWAWPLGPRRDLPLTVFAVAAGWFVVRAVGQHAAAGAGHPGHGRLAYLHSAASMGTMVWMVALAPAAVFASATGSGRRLMAGMSDVAMQHGGTLAGLHPTVVNTVLGGYFAAVAVAWAGKTALLMRAGGPELAMACHALMSAGMGLLLLATV